MHFKFTFLALLFASVVCAAPNPAGNPGTESPKPTPPRGDLEDVRRAVIELQDAVYQLQGEVHQLQEYKRMQSSAHHYNLMNAGFTGPEM
ncbi:hypothetical protein F5878DRAFT_661772 [Lentinula raphanica]|uniref:Uncharacterized protein n=1 Tax=Lentinula raphanica TaxID=153919 RepID=A0AA38P7K4_9AGAR|nr:hypothetical protein F5878DRAFT_661772 [Lentinula raphanica]